MPPTDSEKLRYQQLAIAILVLIAISIFTAIYFTFHTATPQPIAARTLSSQPTRHYSSTDILNSADTGDIEKVKAIVRADPDAVKLKDEKQRTALHLAAHNGHN